ncbi:hypothetical protein N0V84_007232 [Fusarium piperis]|uniref:Maltose/galactoside acetyltransferase domain-containing protein n=1 Tax=Fusarium piperis TaxID=1435070 RepID=A0A9W9BLY6_9HYPO|nr:hypothetical protein N0V84_007232 [Fusarium piperis]
MFDKSFTRSKDYFVALQLLRIMDEWINEARSSIEALRDSSAIKRSIFCVEEAEDNFDAAIKKMNQRATRLQNRVRKKSEQINSLRDGLFNATSLREATKAMALNQAIYIFTVVTVLFTPLSFLAVLLDEAEKFFRGWDPDQAIHPKGHQERGHLAEAYRHSCLLRVLRFPDPFAMLCEDSRIKASVTAIFDVCAAIPRNTVFYKRLLFPLFLTGADTSAPHQMHYASWCVGEIKQATGFQHPAMTEMLTKVWEERRANPHGWSNVPWMEFWAWLQVIDNGGATGSWEYFLIKISFLQDPLAGVGTHSKERCDLFHVPRNVHESIVKVCTFSSSFNSVHVETTLPYTKNTMAATEKSATELKKASKLANVPHCEQYDRMISGMLYDSFVPELVKSRLDGRKFMHEYNNWFPSGDDEYTHEAVSKKRADMLRNGLGHVADDELIIEPPFRVDYGPNVSVGKRFYSNFNLTILDSAIVTIGDRVMVGPNVMISTATHEIEVASRRDNIEYAKPITIGNDCWIGGGVIILPGVTIGDGCTIGAGSIVTRDIPAWSVALGSPARVVKKVQELPLPEE